MGFFGSLFGNDQRRAISRATRGANSILETAAGTARDELNTGFDEQQAALQGGYTQGRGALNTGFDTARTDLTDQYGRAEGALTDAQAYVREVLSPFMQSGQRAQALYDTALGLDGQPAAQNFYSTYAANDPFREFNEDMANRSLARSFNAGGALGSGRAALAASRANLERGSQDLNRYLDRLASQGAQGGQYATRIADNAASTGAQLANVRTGLGDRLGSLETDRGVRLGAMDYGYGVDSGNIAGARGNANANLTYGVAQQRANNRLGMGNSIANIQTQGVNNLLQLGGAVIGAWGNRPR